MQHFSDVLMGILVLDIMLDGFNCSCHSCQLTSAIIPHGLLDV